MIVSRHVSLQNGKGILKPVKPGFYNHIQIPGILREAVLGHIETAGPA
jgi:hypothetical protein